MASKRFAVKLEFPESIHDNWDHGTRKGGTFTMDSYHSFPPGSGSNPSHPGPGKIFRWGCFSLNFWFTCLSGRTWYEAASIAKRWLTNHCNKPGTTFEIVAE